MTSPNEPMNGDDDLQAGHLDEINGSAPQADPSAAQPDNEQPPAPKREDMAPGDVNDPDNDGPVHRQYGPTADYGEG